MKKIKETLRGAKPREKSEKTARQSLRVRVLLLALCLAAIAVISVLAPTWSASLGATLSVAKFNADGSEQIAGAQVTEGGVSRWTGAIFALTQYPDATFSGTGMPVSKVLYCGKPYEDTIFLAPGYYLMREVQAPDGYALDSTPYQVTVTAGSITVVDTHAAGVDQVPGMAGVQDLRANIVNTARTLFSENFSTSGEARIWTLPETTEEIFQAKDPDYFGTTKKYFNDTGNTAGYGGNKQHFKLVYQDGDYREDYKAYGYCLDFGVNPPSHGDMSTSQTRDDGIWALAAALGMRENSHMELEEFNALFGFTGVGGNPAAVTTDIQRSRLMAAVIWNLESGTSWSAITTATGIDAAPNAVTQAQFNRARTVVQQLYAAYSAPTGARPTYELVYNNTTKEISFQSIQPSGYAVAPSVKVTWTDPTVYLVDEAGNILSNGTVISLTTALKLRVMSPVPNIPFEITFTDVATYPQAGSLKGIRAGFGANKQEVGIGFIAAEYGVQTFRCVVDSAVQASVRVEAKNKPAEPEGILSLRKMNADGSRRLDGAVFTVYRCATSDFTGASTPYGEPLTCSGAGADPEIALPPGYYVLRETAAPNGYELDVTPYYITVNANGEITVVDNHPTGVDQVDDMPGVQDLRATLVPSSVSGSANNILVIASQQNVAAPAVKYSDFGTSYAYRVNNDTEWWYPDTWPIVSYQKSGTKPTTKAFCLDMPKDGPPQYRNSSSQTEEVKGWTLAAALAEEDNSGLSLAQLNALFGFSGSSGQLRALQNTEQRRALLGGVIWHFANGATYDFLLNNGYYDNYVTREQHNRAVQVMEELYANYNTSAGAKLAYTVGYEPLTATTGDISFSDISERVVAPKVIISWSSPSIVSVKNGTTTITSGSTLTLTETLKLRVTHNGTADFNITFTDAVPTPKAGSLHGIRMDFGGAYQQLGAGFVELESCTKTLRYQKNSYAQQYAVRLEAKNKQIEEGSPKALLRLSKYNETGATVLPGANATDAQGQPYWTGAVFQLYRCTTDDFIGANTPYGAPMQCGGASDPTMELPPGRYVLKETKAPDGYVLDPHVYYIQVDENGEISVVDTHQAGLDLVGYIGGVQDLRAVVTHGTADVSTGGTPVISDTQNVAAPTKKFADFGTQYKYQVKSTTEDWNNPSAWYELAYQSAAKPTVKGYCLEAPDYDPALGDFSNKQTAEDTTWALAAALGTEENSGLTLAEVNAMFGFSGTGSGLRALRNDNDRRVFAGFLVWHFTQNTSFSDATANAGGFVTQSQFDRGIAVIEEIFAAYQGSGAKPNYTMTYTAQSATKGEIAFSDVTPVYTKVVPKLIVSWSAPGVTVKNGAAAINSGDAVTLTAALRLTVDHPANAQVDITFTDAFRYPIAGTIHGIRTVYPNSSYVQDLGLGFAEFEYGIKTLGIGREATETAEVHLQVKNKKPEYTFNIEKRNGKTNALLPGAKFTLTGIDGTSYGPTEFTTNGSGMISISLPQTNGSYRLHESAPPANFEGLPTAADYIIRTFNGDMYISGGPNNLDEVLARADGAVLVKVLGSYVVVNPGDANYPNDLFR